jgi:hypothetical protein
LAAERALANQNLSFAPNCALNAKLSEAEIDAARKKLPAEWIQHRLPRDYLDRKEISKRIDTQVDRFSTFLKQINEEFGPMLPEAWLWQFTDPDLRDSALRLLEHITYIEADTVRAAFREFIKSVDGFQDALWIPLRQSTGAAKSSDLLSRYLKDIVVNAVPTIRNLTVEKIQNAKALVFFDDSLNSGTQVANLLASWLGSAENITHVQDADDSALDVEVLSALKTAPICFAYYSAHPSGIVRLKDICKKLGLNLKAVQFEIDSSEDQYRLAGLSCASKASKDRFLEHLSKIGTELLIEQGKDPDTAAEYSLGYSGIDLTIVYAHSISASTPAALWIFSDDALDPWIPIFPRKDPQIILDAVKYGLEPLPEERMPRSRTTQNTQIRAAIAERGDPQSTITLALPQQTRNISRLGALWKRVCDVFR